MQCRRFNKFRLKHVKLENTIEPAVITTNTVTNLQYPCVFYLRQYDERIRNVRVVVIMIFSEIQGVLHGLDQVFLFDPVVLESICCRTRARRLINESKMTG